MRPLRAGVQRFIGLFRRGARERDLQAELESHLQLHIDDNIRAGMAPEEAREDKRTGGVGLGKLAAAGLKSLRHSVG